MTKVQSALRKYVAPFLAGVCMAATTVVGGIASVLALVVVAGMLAFLSFQRTPRSDLLLGGPSVPTGRLSKSRQPNGAKAWTR
jgi:hypothetical protein